MHSGSIKELTLESNGRRWLSRVSVSSSSGPSGLSKELEHKTEEEKENCQANEKPNNGGYGRLSKGTRRICNQMNSDNDQLFLELNIKHFPSDLVTSVCTFHVIKLGDYIPTKNPICTTFFILTKLLEQF